MFSFTSKLLSAFVILYLGGILLSPTKGYFALPIPTCWFPKTLADPTRANNAQQESIMPNVSPKSEPMEYSSRWVPESWVCFMHVHFMLFVSISFALGTLCESVFWWNMGLKCTNDKGHPIQSPMSYQPLPWHHHTNWSLVLR